MIKIYDAEEKLFNHNGIKILKPLKCNVFKEDNGDYYIELEDNIKNNEYYQPNRIIMCPTPFPEGEQAFRIANNIEKNQSKIKLKAKHIYFDTKNYVIKDNYIEDKDCNYALDYLNSNTDTESPFTTSSDITTNNSYRCVRKSLEESISTIIDKWGGHLVRNNFNISVNSTIGKDRGVTLKYLKNIQTIKSEEIWDNVVTKILPVGKDGLLLPEIYLELEEQLYNIPYTKVVSFNQEIEKLETESDDEYKERLIEDLRSQATSFLNVNKYPQVNYSLSAHLDKITDIGDTIYVEHPNLNIALTTNVISVTYDAISNKYKNIQFGNFKNSLKNLINDISKQTSQIAQNISNDTKTILNEELKKATSEIWNMMGDSFVIYDGDKILIVDALPKEDATNVIMLNSGGIGFSQTGINGVFNSAWTIDGTLDMQSINIINLVADMIKGGTLKLGGENNKNGVLEIYDVNSNLIGKFDNLGLYVNFDGTMVSLVDKLNGITNIFTTNGGQNLLRNTAPYFMESDNVAEFWDGNVRQGKEPDSTSGFSLLLQNNAISQNVILKNGKYTLSYKWKRLIPLSKATVKYNGKTTELLTDVDSGFITLTDYITTGSITFEANCDTNDGIEIYDLMLNIGEVAIPWTQNANETTSDTVNISKGITVASDATNTVSTMKNDGFKVKNKTTEETVMEATDTGGKFKDLTSTGLTNLSGLIIQTIGDEIWISGGSINGNN